MDAKARTGTLSEEQLRLLGRRGLNVARRMRGDIIQDSGIVTNALKDWGNAVASELLMALIAELDEVGSRDEMLLRLKDRLEIYGIELGGL